MSFHSRTGTLVRLTNGSKTAERTSATNEFNNAIVFSERPLRDNELFEVKIDSKLNTWSGSLEMGVTTCNPDTVSLSASSTGLKNGTWIMSGTNVLKDGLAVKEGYGPDLERLSVGDALGVMRTSAGILHFFINGEDQGIAASGIPANVYAIIDVYGKCTQVTLTACRLLDPNQQTFLANQLANEAIAEATALCSNEILAFHEKCGSLVRLTNDNRTAERQRPHGEFNNGVVMTNRPLKADELFEIRLDTMIDKWSGSIEVGITTHNPSLLDFPATMTNMRSGTVMMSGCGILTNGKGTQREYGQFNLDELAESDRIGLIRKQSGSLHFYINGIDQGVAAENAPEMVWGVVDLYGMAVKVTIVDDQDVIEEEEGAGVSSSYGFLYSRSSLPSATSSRRRSHIIRSRHYSESESDSVCSDHLSTNTSDTQTQVSRDPLTFHPVCGRNVDVINRNKTARRPNAMDEFNHAVVLSNRPLLPGEWFEIRLDKVIDKWAGSVELGVTVHDPLCLDFPSVMSNMLGGTWMMTGNGIMYNNETVIEDYGYRPDQMKAGDRVGVMRTKDGCLLFSVNGQNLGVAAVGIPEKIYGVLDLYGQAAEASVVQAEETYNLDLRFHNRHGSNCVVLNEGRSVSRPHPREEFNDAVVMTSRPLRLNELFEVVVDKMVDRWSGSLECGVTTLNPDNLEFPSSMSDLSPPGTYILSGCSIVQDGYMMRTRYNCDLEQIETGSRIGMLVSSDRCLHFYLNGVDQGVACSDIPDNVYGVIDLYGACAGVSITGSTAPSDSQSPASIVTVPTTQQLNEQKAASAHRHRFSKCCGRNILLRNENTTATRTKNFDHGIVYSADPVKTDELFEIRIDQVARQWSGSLVMGFTTQTVSESQTIAITQATALDLHSSTKKTWLISGSTVTHNGEIITENYLPSLDRLEVGCKVGIKRCSDGTMHLYVNGEDLGVAARHIPRNVFLIVDIYGSVESVSITSKTKNSRLQNESHVINETLPVKPAFHTNEEGYDVDTRAKSYSFFTCVGRNIQLRNKDTVACRVNGYNQAVVLVSKPLTACSPFIFKVDKLNPKWTSSFVVGVTNQQAESISSLKSALSLTKSTWLIKSNSVFHNGKKIKNNYCTDLNNLEVGSTISLSIDNERSLHLHINGVDEGVAAKCMPDPCYPLIDLYGKCSQVSIVHDEDGRQFPKEDREKADMENGIKEKTKVPTNTNCSYQQLCDRFRLCTSLPDEFFKSKFNKCFCYSCHSVRGGATHKVRGSPGKEYTVPVGWYRFGLKVKPRVKSMKIFDNWNVAYNGVKIEAVRKILDSGDLISVANDAVQQTVSFAAGDEKKPDRFESVPVILTPNLHYASCHHFTQPVDYKDAKTGKLYQVKLAFEVCIKPGSFNVGPQTLDTNDLLDSKLNSNEMEWATKERGSVEIYGLLIQLTPPCKLS